ncbi:MAG TPA: penicillin-binding protein activator LpoB, partial [Bacteroidales bacterium]|nr:penicillin-binding protein activator LpoB [Bacteroidales bacterium]
MKSLFKNLSLLALLLIVISSCQQRSVTRVSPDQTIDLSGRWNDTDARLTAEAMIQEALGTTWLTDFTQEKGSKPVV